MELNSIDGKTNFFEKRVTEYQIAGTSSQEQNFDLSLEYF